MKEKSFDVTTPSWMLQLRRVTRRAAFAGPGESTAAPDAGGRRRSSNACVEEGGRETRLGPLCDAREEERRRTCHGIKGPWNTRAVCLLPVIHSEKATYDPVKDDSMAIHASRHWGRPSRSWRGVVLVWRCWRHTLPLAVCPLECRPVFAPVRESREPTICYFRFVLVIALVLRVRYYLTEKEEIERPALRTVRPCKPNRRSKMTHEREQPAGGKDSSGGLGLRRAAYHFTIYSQQPQSQCDSYSWLDFFLRFYNICS